MSAIADADSVVVFRLGALVDTARFGRVVLGRTRASGGWLRRVNQLLSDVLLYRDGEPGRRRIGEPAHGRFVLQFLGARDTVTAHLWLADPRLEVWDRDGLAGRGHPDPMRWDALIGLMREAFPRDAAVQRLRLEPPARGSYVFLDSLPVVVERAVPEYPDHTGRGLEGTVLVEVLVGTDGRVKQARILRSVPSFDAAVLDAVSRWRFRPALSRGRPVEARVAVPFDFSLH
jgi:protein TonB